MKTTASSFTWRYSKLTYAMVVLLWALYVVLLFLRKTDNSQIHIGLTATNIIRVSFALPILAIWLTATVAAVRFKNYTHLITGSREAAGFNRLANGLFFLTAYLISVLLVSRVAALFAGTSFVYPVVFVKNHLSAYLFLISLIQLYRGAIALADITKVSLTRRQNLLIMLSYTAFTAIFVALFFHNPTNPKTLADGLPSFAVSHGVLLFTLILPSLMAWILGILASMTIRAYAAKVKGTIYKQALHRLVIGIFGTTTFAILVQLLVLYASKLQHLGINALLFIVYVFLLAYGVGAALIARSARKLTLIEVTA